MFELEETTISELEDSTVSELEDSTDNELEETITKELDEASITDEEDISIASLELLGELLIAELLTNVIEDEASAGKLEVLEEDGEVWATHADNKTMIDAKSKVRQ